MTEPAIDNATISVLDVDQAAADGGGVPLFAVTFRGYDRYEVEHHLAELDERIGELVADREAGIRELVEARTQLAAVDAAEAVAGYPTYKAMGERIARLFAIAEEEVAAMKSTTAMELDRARREAERIGVAAGDDRQALLDDAHESVRQMKAEAQREIAEVDAQVTQARARAEDAAAAQLAELDRRLQARELACRERLEDREATARERLAEVVHEYEDVSGRLRQIAAQISVVDEVPVGEIPAVHHHHSAMTGILPTEPEPAAEIAEPSPPTDQTEPSQTFQPQDEDYS
jgi:DNA repair exonuclease SbcCD ATPase subunit